MDDMVYHALIRTHHIVSRKKVAVLKAAAKKFKCFALLRSGGGVPGVMYVQGPSKTAVQSWVDTVHGLRYKDYQLVAPVEETTTPASASPSASSSSSSSISTNVGTGATMLGPPGVLQEVDKVKDMASWMRDMDGKTPGLIEWWRKAMGFVR